MTNPLLLRHLLTKEQIQDKQEREFLTTCVPELNALIEGFPRGAITEVTGPPSSGRTTIAISLLAAATARGEYCAIVDGSDNFDPHTLAAAGADLTRVLWVRCRGNAEHAIKCADMLIHAGGWGVVLLDLAGVANDTVRRIPISWWYRFRRAVEPTPTAMVVLEREPFVRACASLAIDMSLARPQWSGAHADFRVLSGFRLEARARKPLRQAPAVFEAKAIA